ncbi:mitochondrial carrier domain-containing protein [Scenedesmus sp. NREL 46B-D3]|nr:mitochondrial carrier domain-containing protein [Scenedesmus sp. NREL 46B-D3]
MVGIAAGQPLDTLRVRLQQRGCQQHSVAGVWKDMARAEGVRGLFRGMSYPVYTTALQNAVTFQAQGVASRLLTGSADKSAACWQVSCLAGMFAGAVQTCISCPVELLKIRLQLQHALPGMPGYVGPWGMLRRVVAQEGVLGLFRGFAVTLARDTPSYGLYFLTYHWMVAGLEYALTELQPALSLSRDALAAAAHHQPTAAFADSWNSSSSSSSSSSVEGSSIGSDLGGGIDSGSTSSSGGAGSQQQQQQRQQQGGSSELLVQFVAGGVAGALAWASVYPLDVVKSRMQAQPRHLSPYHSAWQCAASSIREEGRGVLAKGLGATMGRGFIVNAAIFASFEAFSKAMAAA